MEDAYVPTPAEEAMAQGIDNLIDAMLSGKLDGIAVVARNKEGEDAFFYLNGPEHPVLYEGISKLMGMYQINQQFKAKIDCPKTNRSYLSH